MQGSSWRTTSTWHTLSWEPSSTSGRWGECLSYRLMRQGGGGGGTVHPPSKCLPMHLFRAKFWWYSGKILANSGNLWVKFGHLQGEIRQRFGWDLLVLVGKIFCPVKCEGYPIPILGYWDKRIYNFGCAWKRRVHYYPPPPLPPQREIFLGLVGIWAWICDSGKTGQKCVPPKKMNRSDTPMVWARALRTF